MTLPTEASKEKPPLHVYPEAKIGTQFYSHFGIQSTRYNGVCALTGSIVLMASGRFVMFVDVHTGKIESMPGPIDGGVGAIAVHPSRKFFVVCEKMPKNPLIRAYSWPSREEVGQFVNGATKGFSACCFNIDGTMMATVGMYPDFSLAVWDWKTRGMILRNKCHSADVYSVAFSQFDSGVLVTGGAGHIKFWSMAKTFTGLKLQGLLGKFGRLDISNEPGFAVLPDGKVLSGSEDGLILIWEGDLVRCCFASEVVKDVETDEETAGLALQSYSYLPCHAGAINVVQLLGNGSVLLTAGDDGYMRYWRVSELEGAEGEGIPPLYAPVCLGEVLVDENAHIRAVTHCVDTDEWVILDSTGALWYLPFLHPDEILLGSPKKVDEPAVAALRFNGGAIMSAALSPCDHTIVTGGEDGSIRLIDYVTPREVYHLQLPLPNTVVALGFLKSDKTGMKLVACCEDGTVRLLQRGRTGFALLGQWRPHNSGLKTFAVDKEERRLCTLSVSGELFFFDIDPELNSLIPIGYCQLPVPDPLCVAWDDTTSTCLVGHECGKILAIRAGTMKDVDQSVSFEFPCTYALVGIRQRKMVEKKPINLVHGEREEDAMEEEEEEDIGPWPVRLICPLPDGSFAIGAGGVELLYQYNTSIRYDGRTELPPLPPTGIEPPDYVEEPIINLCYRNLIPQDASLSVSEHSLVVVCDGAQMFIRTLDSSSNQWRNDCILVSSSHDRLDGHIAAACTSFDDTMVVSAGSDGLVVAQLLDGCSAPSRPQIDSMYPSLHAEEVEAPEFIPLSISEQKEEEDRRRAEEAKQCELEAFLEKLHVVHAKYAELLEANSEIPEDLQLSENEMILHPQIIQELEEEKERRVRESRMDTALELAREDVRTHKMRKRFIDNLIYDRFLVYSFSKEFAVASFRTPDPTKAIENFEVKITELLESDKNEEVGLDDPSITNDKKSKHVEVSDDTLCNLALSTAAAITEWLLIEEQKQQQERQKQNREDGEVLTSTMRQHLDKLDDRREERSRRKKGHEILLSNKPSPETEAAKLDEEMKFEIARRGDFVLRTDPLYHLIPSAVAKLRQLIKLERVLLDLRTTFTKKLLLMRDEKAKLCESLNILLGRIRTINEKLKDDSIPAADVSLQDIELPEKRFTIDRDGLDAFAKQRQLEKDREEMAKKAQRGFGADLAAGDNTTTTTSNTNNGISGAPNPPTGASLPSEAVESESVNTKRTSARISVGEGRPSMSRRSKTPRLPSGPKASRSQSTAFLAAAAVRERMDYDLRVKLENVKPTEAEEEEQHMERELLSAERRQLLCRVNSIMKEFDQRLWEMYEERAKVDADLCLAHTRSLLLFHEYQILLVFRQKDRELRRQYEEAKCSRDKRKKEMEELQKGVQQQMKVIEKLQDTSKAFRHEVEYFIETNFPTEHVPYITKVFLRQIKRRKHLGDVSADDDDITSDDDEEEVNEDDLWEEICPPHCSEERWREVLAKREIRLDYADSIAEARRKQEQMQRSIDEHVVLAEQHNNVLTTCLKAIEDFQNEKRKQLNMLGTLVMLRCSQVKCLEEDGKCPETFCRDDLVVVSENVVSGLHRRIETMAEEKRERRLTLKNMASELQRLQRERAAKQALHTQWEEKIYEAMLLKFGQVVNLELLESTSGCRAVEEMKERLRAEELAWERALRRRERTITRLRERLQDTLLRNTHLLHDLGDQASDKHTVDGALVRATQNVVGRMYDGSQVATEEDRRNLRLLIAAQQEEIDALMAEIAMLRSKGGHVYAPTTTISI